MKPVHVYVFLVIPPNNGVHFSGPRPFHSTGSTGVKKGETVSRLVKENVK